MNSALRIETARLSLRWLDARDAEFIYRLVNDSDWLRFIGDKQVHDLDSARAYIETGPQAMYRHFGFGLNRIALRESDTPIGICGLLQRDSLPDCDLGFALLPEFRGQGYAFEAAGAVLRHGFSELDKKRVAALVNAANRASIGLLGHLGFRRDSSISMEPDTQPVDLYIIDRAD